MADAIRVRGHTVVELPAPPVQSEPAADGDYARWLGVRPEDDAAETVVALDGERPDWLIVDHYALDATWERVLRPHVGRIAVIDDLANRCHDADMLLDQNYSTEGAARYDGLLPDHAQRLCGPGYALLNPVYAEYRQKLPARTGEVARVLVFFGGTDPENLTGMALEALSTPALRHLAVDVVVGANYPHRAALEEQAHQRSGTTLHGPRPHLADLIAAADLAVGAGGTTTWERCCLGLPSLVVSIADNQRPACEALAQDGLIAYGGHWDGVSAERLRDTLAELIADSVRLRQMAEAGRRAVDGEGTRRLAKHLNEASNARNGA